MRILTPVTDHAKIINWNLRTAINFCIEHLLVDSQQQDNYMWNLIEHVKNIMERRTYSKELSFHSIEMPNANFSIGLSQINTPPQTTKLSQWDTAYVIRVAIGEKFIGVIKEMSISIPFSIVKKDGYKFTTLKAHDKPEDNHTAHLEMKDGFRYPRYYVFYGYQGKIRYYCMRLEPLVPKVSQIMYYKDYLFGRIPKVKKPKKKVVESDEELEIESETGTEKEENAIFINNNENTSMDEL